MVQQQLLDQGLKGEPLTRTMDYLANNETNNGNQIARIITSGRLNGISGYPEILSETGNNNKDFAADKVTELRFAHELTERVPPVGDFMFPQGASDKHNDADVQITTGERENWHSCQIKNAKSPNSAKNNIRKVINQTSGEAAEGTNKIGLLEAKGSYEDFPASAVDLVRNKFETSGVAFRLYSDDGVMTIPEDAQIYPN